MMYRYFDISEETTLDDVKKQYRKLCMKTHPDKGGSLREFRAVNAEYRKALEEIQERALNANDINLYQLINNKLINIDSAINKLDVPEKLKPAISLFAEKGINHLGKVISKKLQSGKKV